MTTHWYRTIGVFTGWQPGQSWQCAIPSGSTYRRVRFSWGFVGHTDSIIALQPMMGNVMIMGLVTTIGNGSESVPDAFSQSGDVAPPTQRWIWWETRAAVPTAVDNASNVITWRDSAPQEPVDVKVNVLATGIPAGDTLNLWARWSAGSWDTSGNVGVWLSTSVLYTTP